MADLPVSRGFDTSIGYLAGGEDYFTKVAEGGACKTQTMQPLDFWDGLHPASDPVYFTTYSAEIYSARAVKLIEAHEAARPFFLYLAMQNVHWPLQVPARFLKPDRSDNKTCSKFESADTCPHRSDDDCGCQHSCYCNRRLKLGMVAALDEAVANITVRTSAHMSVPIIILSIRYCPARREAVYFRAAPPEECRLLTSMCTR